MSNLFQKLEIEAFRRGIQPRTRESRDWFRRRIQRLTRVNRSALLNEPELTKADTFGPGRMMMYFYDPKHKETLPYYDKFPLTVVVDRAPGGFFGLNLHYLPPVLRAKLLDSLLDVTNNTAYDDSTKFNVSARLLKSAAKFKYYEPCYKHYLTSHVKSRFSVVQPSEWEIATFLPTAQWRKASASRVYSDSRKVINS
jgi:hypothetical protein